MNRNQSVSQSVRVSLTFHITNEDFFHSTHRPVIFRKTIALPLRSPLDTLALVGAKPAGGGFLRCSAVDVGSKFATQSSKISRRRGTITIIRSFLTGIFDAESVVFTAESVGARSKQIRGGGRHDLVVLSGILLLLQRSKPRRRRDCVLETEELRIAVANTETEL